MKVNPESVSKAIKLIMLNMVIVMSSYIQDELNQPKKRPEPNVLIERLRKQGIITERKCIYTRIYDGEWPEPCPTNERLFYGRYQQWKKKNGR